MKLIWELFITFFKVGAFTIGGGLAMLPVIRKAVVEERGWLTEEEIVDCFAVSQSLPGVLAINAAIYVGNKKKGLQGSLASLLGVILPSYISIIVILLFLGSIEENTHVLGAFEGIKAASAAMILVAAYKLGKQILKGKVEIFIAVISFAVIVFAGINAVWAILFGGLTGLVVYQYNKRKGRAE
ncbi:chromate transporter [Anoxybacterium hadale]|uniref:Chromate transporter n=1 Tax=Anoxybacterium hadale TaxID=3408580 RepID=A0ACD1AFU7_9FIRM|nr:chromate transporter [Clostridiales bacterium]